MAEHGNVTPLVGPELTSTQFAKQKGWEIYSAVEGKNVVTTIKHRSKVLKIQGNLTMASVRLVEKFFAEVVEGILSPVSASDVGLTNKEYLRITGAEDYDQMGEAVRDIIRDQGELEDGVISFEFSAGYSVVKSFQDYMEKDDYFGKVRATTAKQQKILQKDGFRDLGDGVFSNCEEEEEEDLYSVLEQLAQEFEQTELLPPGGRSDEAPADAYDDLRNRSYLDLLTNTDLNRIKNLDDFKYAGGRPLSKRKEGKIPSLFPRETLTAEEFGARVEENIRREGRNLIVGFRSDKELAKGLIATRHGQMSVNGNMVTFREL